jgi:hypothetical protein
MRKPIAISTILGAVLAASVCSAQVVVKQEPMEGTLRTGATVLVDDGTCGAGKIKLISSTGGNGNELKGLPPRTRTCVSRQSVLH